jgi:hypothetical protein
MPTTSGKLLRKYILHKLPYFLEYPAHIKKNLARNWGAQHIRANIGDIAVFHYMTICLLS